MQTGFLTMVVASLDLITFLTDVRDVPRLLGPCTDATVHLAVSFSSTSRRERESTCSSQICCQYSDRFPHRHLIFNFPLAKLYTNSLMSSLNARQGWQFSNSGKSMADSESGNHTASLSTRPNVAISRDIKSVSVLSPFCIAQALNELLTAGWRYLAP